MPLRGLLASNRQWAARTVEDDPDFFNRLANQQAPQYLWIGCSDSRVPSTQLVDLAPGEMFVHRNVANQVIHTDFNCLSVLQFAVEVLQVRHIIVTGHYQCGGVKAAYADTRLGLIDNWLRPIQAIAALHEAELDALPPERRFDRLCELNVMEQVRHVAQTTIVQDAWARGQPLQVHGWIYNVADGLLHDLRVSLSAAADVAPRLP